MSSMYLCSPSREALGNWKRALEEDSTIFLADLKKVIGGIDINSEGELENLVSEYTRLFIGPYKLPCPPWESVYTSPKRLMMQEAASQVRAIYAEAGLISNTDEVMPDHIGVELNFLAVLLKQAHSGSFDKEQQAKRIGKLLNEHLLKWVPKFTHDMEDSAETQFYRALAKTTRQVIDVIGR